MTERRLKRPVVYAIYALGVISLISTIYLIEGAMVNKKLEEPEDYSYVSKTIFDNAIPVVKEMITLTRPYKDNDITVLRTYYDYKADSTSQENSLIYYEGTYIPSSGVAYSKADSFEVVSILDGTVTEIKEDDILGNIVTVEHENGIISIYQSVGEISVKVNDTVTGGQVIAKSSTSNISTDLGNHLYFELIIDGICVDPENYYDKSVNEI